MARMVKMMNKEDGRVMDVSYKAARSMMASGWVEIDEAQENIKEPEAPKKKVFNQSISRSDTDLGATTKVKKGKPVVDDEDEDDEDEDDDDLDDEDDDAEDEVTNLTKKKDKKK